MEIGWSELLVIGIVALIVIGPKDLPEMFRTLGRFTAKMRAMAREFSSAMEDAAKSSGVKDVADDLRKATDLKSTGLDAVKSAADKFEKWDPLKAAKAAQNFSPKAMAGNAVKSAVLGTGAATGAATAAAAADQTPAPQAPFDVELPPPLPKTAAPEPVSVAALPVQDIDDLIWQEKPSSSAAPASEPPKTEG